MWALTADADFLAQRGQGQVEQVFARAVNIALPARQQLLTLLCEEYDNAPNSCRLALTHFDDLFRHGAGPVGLLTIACARLLGAEQIFVVDHHPYRLRFAADRYGAIPINFDEDSDPAQSIIEQTAGHRGVDAVIDAVGFEAKGSTTETVLTNLKLEGSSGKALRQCIAAVRRGGIVSVPGVYAGFIHGFLFGDAFDKGLTFKMGQTHVHAWLGELLPLIEKGLLKPEEIVTHYMPFEEAARGYEIFEKREEECRKVILVPGAQSAEAAQKAVSGLVNAMPGGTI
ncbi:zinc-binding dehydrogenase [Escherichia coli]